MSEHLIPQSFPLWAVLDAVYDQWSGKTAGLEAFAELLQSAQSPYGPYVVIAWHVVPARKPKPILEQVGIYEDGVTVGGSREEAIAAVMRQVQP